MVINNTKGFVIRYGSNERCNYKELEDRVLNAIQEEGHDPKDLMFANLVPKRFDSNKKYQIENLDSDEELIKLYRKNIS
jgi:hypothetical protein